ncbi:AI-2E family transporter [Synechococcus sp. CS-1325]|uniref:AI-2E family transporter n=1 Tax=unclassified Synechococcus TaxID=2626047 RepID=UPI000DB1A6FD|nr:MULTISPECIES: AI-2E family transporter [unclassified Synechococcus]PZU96626.1 MAG: AI-2E family transporter [Cyanobium sp.]MCT0200889.1 AI-2E family transporter [Synechococcus sp. CS-1325]MCT0213927.1 AI-2E family transporter [Synechococcus sp. CS-1326]MCT0230829.1 AI-2E family transporter [Synechococcus sp. CS-1324]MCT0233503.1 AI-2E family transporter [Synechococcus sp. CS-1327]
MKFGQWLGLAGTAAAVALLWSLRDVLVQVFAAIVLAMALCTLVGFVRRQLGCGRPLALLLSLLGLLVLLVLAVTVLIPPFAAQFAELLTKVPAAAELLLAMARSALTEAARMIYGRQDATLELDWFQQFQQLLPSGSEGSAALASGLGEGLGRLLGLAGNLGGGLLQLLFVVAVSVMVAVQPTAYRDVAVLLIPSFYRRRFRQVLDGCGTALSDWMVGVLISSCCVALLSGIGLMLLGVKLVVANALLAGLLNVIPNVGPTLSTIFPVSVALLDAPWKALAVIGLYLVIQHLESYLITPSVMQHQLSLLPGLTLTAQFLFTVLFGPLGLLLALPMAVCLQVIVREVLIHDVLDPWKRQRSLG